MEIRLVCYTGRFHDILAKMINSSFKYLIMSLIYISDFKMIKKKYFVEDDHHLRGKK